MLQVEDSILHEDGVAQEHAIGQASVWNPLLVSQDVYGWLAHFVLQDQWHDHQGEPNDVNGSRKEQVEHASDHPDIWVVIHS